MAYLNNTSATWCVNPYINLALESSGSAKVCCMSTQFINDLNGNTVSIINMPVTEIWKQPSRLEVAAALEAGIRHPNCQLCWNEDDAGQKSKRVRDNETFNAVDVSKVIYPMVVDLKLGNECNLKCRTCNSSSSSAWIKEEYDVYFKSNSTYTEFIHNDKLKNIRVSYADYNENFWKDIENILPYVKYFDIYGGEPMYVKKHWDFIRKSNELGFSKNQSIHYNTNGTIFPEHIDLLDSFKSINVQFSVDGIEDKFTYARHPANWNVFVDNVAKYKEHQRLAPNEWKFDVCLTISAYNIFYLDEIFDYMTDTLGLAVYLNLIHGPENLACFVYPPAVKELITAKLNSYTPANDKWAHPWKTQLPGVLMFLNNTPDKNLITKFWETTKLHDQYRNESFEITFPEVYNLIKGYV